jgi:hypothetical protein
MHRVYINTQAYNPLYNIAWLDASGCAELYYEYNKSLPCGRVEKQWAKLQKSDFLCRFQIYTER